VCELPRLKRLLLQLSGLLLQQLVRFLESGHPGGRERALS
jgi:hypothetical protein